MAWQCSLLLAFLAVFNLGAFFLARHDKLMAQRRGARVPERTLLLLAFMGAGPGLIASFYNYRHKTRKTSFLVVFWPSALVGAVLWWGWLDLFGCFA